MARFTVSMKCPDALDGAAREAASIDVNKLFDVGKLDADAWNALVENRFYRIKTLCCERWFEYGEYLRVEIDTDAGTCTVVEN